MMPGLDGYQVCERVRESGDVPITTLTARSQLIDMVRGVGTGADDYITKPFDPDELLARVQRALRQSKLQGKSHEPFTCNGLSIDFVNRRVTVEGKRGRIDAR